MVTGTDVSELLVGGVVGLVRGGGLGTIPAGTVGLTEGSAVIFVPFSAPVCEWLVGADVWRNDVGAGAGGKAPETVVGLTDGTPVKMMLFSVSDRVDVTGGVGSAVVENITAGLSTSSTGSMVGIFGVGVKVDADKMEGALDGK